jgi:hypothetical protein
VNGEEVISSAYATTNYYGDPKEESDKSCTQAASDIWRIGIRNGWTSTLIYLYTQKISDLVMRFFPLVARKYPNS